MILTGEILNKVSLFLPQILHALAWDRNPLFFVRCRRLTVREVAWQGYLDVGWRTGIKWNDPSVLKEGPQPDFCTKKLDKKLLHFQFPVTVENFLQ